MTLRERMIGKVPQALVKLVPKRFDVIGDVAIISIPSELDQYTEEIASQLVSMRGDVHTVLNKVSKLNGDRRVAGFERIYGNTTVTTHQEYGRTYRLDVSSMFFNSRLGYERQRVAEQVIEGEKVLVPFCGVGPFAIPAGCNGGRVVAVELNSYACRYLARNIELNRVEDMHIINADAFSIPNMIEDTFDRAIVPTPYGMDEFLWTIEPLIKKGGHVHFYTFKTREQIEGLKKEYEENGFEVKLIRRCGNIAPGVSRWGFDLVRKEK